MRPMTIESASQHPDAWQSAVKRIAPQIVRIRTQESSGTGFLVARMKTGARCGLATAAHVVEHANEKGGSITLVHEGSGKPLELTAAKRRLQLDTDADTAALVFENETFELPSNLVPLIPAEKFLMPGAAVGWLGYPDVWSEQLCFFGGRVSCYSESEHAYLLDGVSIDGLSGGPVFHLAPNGEPVIIGVLSEYISNRTPRGPLPGLSMARDVFRFHAMVDQFRSWDEKPPKG